MERVSVILGKKPVILICPHGPNDVNTDRITELAAQQLNCYAVINRGFERADEVDVDNDKADCNRIDHVKQDVVYDEFLRPIERFEHRMVNKSNNTYNQIMGYSLSYTADPIHIFHIHGCGNHVHKEANENIELIVGYGLGVKKDSLSCDVWRKNLFIDLYRKYAGFGDVFEGRGGGRYAGRDSNNLNQYFRKHVAKSWIHSMQLEFPFSLRKTESDAVTTAMQLSVVIGDYITSDSYDLTPSPKFI